MANFSSISLRAVGPKKGILALEKAFQTASSYAEDQEENYKANSVGQIVLDSLYIKDLSPIDNNYYFIELSCVNRLDLNGLLLNEFPNNLLALARNYDIYIETLSTSEMDICGIYHTFIAGKEGMIFNVDRSMPTYAYRPDEADDTEQGCLLDAYLSFCSAPDTRIFSEFMFISKTDIGQRLNAFYIEQHPLPKEPPFKF